MLAAGDPVGHRWTRFLLPFGFAVCLVLVAAHCSRPDGADPRSAAKEPAVFTTILPGTPGPNGEAFEPSIAIDPNAPNRILVAAMYGNPGARGGRNIWAWQSEDGGKSWSSGRMRPANINGTESGWAADVIAGFDAEGSAVLTSMAGADQPRTGGLGGIIVSRRAKGDTGFSEPLLVMRDKLGSTPSRTIGYDKPWMKIDDRTVYLTSGILDMDLPVESWARTPVSLSQITMLGLDFAVSKDGGRTFGPVRRLADSVFGSDLAIEPDGALNVVYPKVAGGRSMVLAIRSTDGGTTFGGPDTVVTGESAASVGGPMIASRPNGEVMVCWAAQQAGGSSARIVCAVRGANGSWKDQRQFAVPLPDGAMAHMPTAAGSAKGWYVLTHVLDTEKTETVVFQSDGSRDFSRFATVASFPGLGIGKWCFDRDCRTHRDDLLMVGDYISIATAGDRVVTAAILPRTKERLVGQSAVWVSVLQE